MADGMHEMCLAETHAAVQEKRVVGLAGGVGDGSAGGMRKATGVTDHERGEGEVPIEPGIGCAVLRIGERSEVRVVVRQRRWFVQWWRCRWIDGDENLAVASQNPRERFPDQRNVAFSEPVAREPSGHAHGEHVAVAVHEHGVRDPRLVPRLRQLEAQFLLRNMPNLMRIEWW